MCTSSAGSRARSFATLLVIAVAGASACVTQKTTTVDVKESPAAVDRIAIRKARATQNEAMATGDVDRAASFWTDDVSLRRGLGQVVNGKAPYRALLQPSGSRDSALVFKRETTDVETSEKWPLAFETGTWSGHLGTVSAPAVIGGRYSAQWIKRDGRWLIRGEVFVALTCSGTGCSSRAEREPGTCMGTRDTRIDAHIGNSAVFAKPILTHLREIIHAACPDVEETMKWSFPHFMYNGVLCSMASFKAHCAFGFWKSKLVMDAGRDDEAMGQFGRTMSVRPARQPRACTAAHRGMDQCPQTAHVIRGRYSVIFARPVSQSR